jgi:hypothetical protein
VEALTPLREAVGRSEEALGRLASMFVDGQLLEAEYREAREAQLRKLGEAEKHLERALQREEDYARAGLVEDAWEALDDMTPA